MPNTNAVTSVTPAQSQAIILIRLSVGLIFLLEGVKKSLVPDAWGVGRFLKIRIPSPSVLTPFVGVVEIVCGAMLIAGFLTRLAALPLVVDIVVAIVTTKLSILLQSGAWAMEAEARSVRVSVIPLYWSIVAH
ncbi:MAG: DoxX family protein [Gemmatimonadaceae bacterium]